MGEHQIINDRLNLTGQQPTPSGPDGFGKSIGEQRARLRPGSKKLGLGEKK
jgi:hypothetical protein